MNKSFALIEVEAVLPNNKPRSEITDTELKMAKEKDYLEAISTIDEFRSLYGGINDDFLKMSLRKVKCLIEMKMFDIAIKELDLLKANKAKFSPQLVDEIDKYISKLSNEKSSGVVRDKSNEESFQKNFKKNFAKNKEDSDNYVWYPVTKEIDEGTELEKDSMFFAFK